jgi:hypothetical protein
MKSVSSAQAVTLETEALQCAEVEDGIEHC